MKLHSRILILVILFGFKGILYLFDGVTAPTKGVSSVDYSGAFINAFTMAFVAYVLLKKKEKWAYWIAVFFAGLVVVRFVLGIGLLLLADPSLLPTPAIVSAILNVVTFGVIPLILLSARELRSLFLHRP